MSEFITEAGKKVTINAAPFGAAISLKNAIQKAILDQKINIAEIEFSEFKGEGISTLINLFATVDSNPEVEKALFTCLERCAYDKQKIIRDTFEDLEARASYYEIVIACVKENLLPFYAPLFSKLKKLEKTNQDVNQK